MPSLQHCGSSAVLQLEESHRRQMTTVDATFSSESFLSYHRHRQKTRMVICLPQRYQRLKPKTGETLESTEKKAGTL